MPDFLDDFFKCTTEVHEDKNGHPRECYIGIFKCGARIIPLFKLARHFPEIRNMKRQMYEVRRLYNQLINIDLALRHTSIKFLTDLATDMREKSQSYSTKATSSNVDQSKLETNFRKTIKLFKRRAMNLPIYPCCSCEKLYHQHDVHDLNKYEEKIRNKMYWIELLKCVPENERKWICIYCNKYIKTTICHQFVF